MSRFPASEQDWIDACALAWRALCTGERGWHVLPGEPFACAVSRGAALLMNHKGFGLPKGYDSDRWDNIARALARRGSCAGDGLVQVGKLRIGPESLPDERNVAAERKAAVEAEWAKVWVPE